MATAIVHATPLGADALLTTDHAASSHGLPVLVVNRRAYGPADLVPYGEGEVPARDVVRQAHLSHQDQPQSGEPFAVLDWTDAEAAAFRAAEGRCRTEVERLRGAFVGGA